MDNLSQLRQYRLTLQPPSLNSIGNGIALFDLVLTFAFGYILYPIVNRYVKVKHSTYYLSLLPLGVLVHALTNQNTFLNKKLFDNTVNLYKISMILVMFMLYKSTSHHI